MPLSPLARALYCAQKKNKRPLAVFFKRELASDTKDQSIKTHILLILKYYSSRIHVVILSSVWL